MNNFLIISFHFDSYTSPRSIRWGKILKYILSKKINIDLITYKRNKIKYPKNLVVHHHENRLVNIFLKDNLSSSQKYSNNIAKVIFTKLLNNFLKLIYKFFVKYIIWPDYSFFLIYPFYKSSIKLLKKKKIKRIITISHPFSCHIVGLLLKLKYPNIIWDVDNSDPFSLMKDTRSNNTYIYRYLNYYFEKLVFMKCRRFYVNNKNTKKKYLKFFNVKKKKIIVSPPLFDGSYKKFFTGLYKSKHFNFVYAGSFYDKIRSPISFFEIISKLLKKFPNLKNEMKCYIFTNSNEFYDQLEKYSDLKSFFIISSLIPHSDLMNFITKDKIVFNIGNNNKVQIPSKLYELMSRGVKIVNLHYSVDDLTKKILINYPNYININVDKEINLDKFYSFIKKRTHSANFFLRNKFKKNSLEYISNKYFN
jgi:hypothetical protein